MKFSPTTRRSFQSLPIENALASALKPVLSKHGFAHYRILSEWEKIVGSNLGSRTAPLKLRFFEPHEAKGKSGGTLYIQTFDSSTAVECQYAEPEILERIAVYFGFQAVKKLVIQQRPSFFNTKEEQLPPKLSAEEEAYAKNFADQAVQNLEPEDPLTSALHDLAESFYKKGRQKNLPLPPG